MPKKINLKTSDNKKITGNFFKSEKSDAPAVILLHMLPAAKESWNDFAEKLNNAGFQCLAIDLRGHGESEGGPIGFYDFSDEEHQKSFYDVEVAVNFFTERRVPLKKISFAGASIGANLSLRFQSENPEIKASILLSLGLNYRGIEIEQAVKKLEEDQAIFISAGGDNDEYSTETVQKIFQLAASKNKEIKVFKNAGHGTAIFKEEPALMDDIVGWLKNIYFI